MTEEEKAEMDAAEKAEAEGDAVKVDTTTPTPTPTPVGNTLSIPDATLATDVHDASRTSLAHHSSFSSTATPTASTSDLSKKDPQKKETKGKPKLTPEQRARLEALEKKQDDEKRQR
jgi:hypothetical protein